MTRRVAKGEGEEIKTSPRGVKYKTETNLAEATAQAEGNRMGEQENIQGSKIQRAWTHGNRAETNKSVAEKGTLQQKSTVGKSAASLVVE